MKNIISLVTGILVAIGLVVTGVAKNANPNIADMGAGEFAADFSIDSVQRTEQTTADETETLDAEIPSEDGEEQDDTSSEVTSELSEDEQDASSSVTKKQDNNRNNNNANTNNSKQQTVSVSKPKTDPKPNNPTMPETKQIYNDGNYTAAAFGYNGDITVTVTIQNDMMTKIKIDSYTDDRAYMQQASVVINQMLSTQSTDVDTVSGATLSCNGIINAVSSALAKAKK